MCIKTNKNYMLMAKGEKIMLTKANKVVMYILSIVTIILGLVTAIPFRTLPFASNCPNILNVEFYVKFLVIPVYALGACVFPNIVKYKQIKKHKTYLY